MQIECKFFSPWSTWSFRSRLDLRSQQKARPRLDRSSFSRSANRSGQCRSPDGWPATVRRYFTRQEAAESSRVRQYWPTLMHRVMTGLSDCLLLQQPVACDWRTASTIGRLLSQIQWSTWSNRCYADVRHYPYVWSEFCSSWSARWSGERLQNFYERDGWT